MNIDCLEYMRTLPDKAFQLAIADPPYGGAGNDISGQNEIRNCRGRFDKYKQIDCARTGGTWASKYGKDIKEWDVAPSQEFFDELERISVNRIIWGANYFTMPPTRCFVIWKKLTISESFTMAMAEYAWTSFNSNAKVIELPPQGKQGDSRFHPTQKPVELYAWLLKNYAKPGDRIFDPMMGSQSSRIAAYKMGFDYVGCELDKEYFAKGCERFDRECRGLIKADNGHTYQQTKLF
jgi:site-specific DNA-methyltransferase (adenine-specific)